MKFGLICLAFLLFDIAVMVKAQEKKMKIYISADIRKYKLLECKPNAHRRHINRGSGANCSKTKWKPPAEGLATRVAFEMTQRILWQHLDDFILVSENDIRQAITLYVEKAHILAEGEGAASLAAALKLCECLAGQTVALVLTGGNITVGQLPAALAGA